MGKSLSSVFLSQISRDQGPIFHLTHQSTKVKCYTQINMLHANTFSTYIDFMKAPNVLIIFLRYQK